MGKCNITTKKFKEFGLKTLNNLENEVLLPSNETTGYQHGTDEHQVYLVGYQYNSSTNCPEIKIRLSDVMEGSGSGEGSNCDCELALRFTANGRLYYTLDGESGLDDNHCPYVEISGTGSGTDISSIQFHWLDSTRPEDATATQNGSVLTLNLPKFEVSGGSGTGPQGPAGDSAYQIWLDNGNSGSETDFLNSLKGPKGDKGNKGDKGDKGDNGEDGASFELYKAVLDFTGQGVNFYTKRHANDTNPIVSNGTAVYKLNPAGISWYQYNPSTHSYDLSDAPVVDDGVIVEIGPSDIWTVGRGWNVANYYVPGMNYYYGTYGFYDYDTDEYHFYTAKDPTGITVAGNSPIQFSVKLYRNISYNSGGGNGGGDEQNYDYVYSLTIDGTTTVYPLLTDSTINSGLINNTAASGTYYYVNETDKDVDYDGEKFKVYIPSGYTVDKVYSHSNNTWTRISETQGYTYIEHTTEQKNGVTYNVYSYVKVAGNGFDHGALRFCFDVLTGTQTPGTVVDENTTNQ